MRTVARLRAELAAAAPADPSLALPWEEAVEKLDELSFCLRERRRLVAVERTRSLATWRLTPRELEVLRHVSREASYGEIALAMGIQVETVRKHTASIRKKLDVKELRDLRR